MVSLTLLLFISVIHCVITEKWGVVDGRGTLTIKLNPSLDNFGTRVYTKTTIGGVVRQLKHPLTVTIGNISTGFSYNLRESFKTYEMTEYFDDDPFCDLAGTGPCGSAVSLCCLDNYGERLSGLYCPKPTGNSLKFYLPRTFIPTANINITVQKNNITHPIILSLSEVIYDNEDIFAVVINNEDSISEYWTSVSFLSWGILNEIDCNNNISQQVSTSDIIFGGDKHEEMKWVTRVTCSNKQSQFGELNWTKTSTLHDLVGVPEGTLTCGQGERRLTIVKNVPNVMVDLSLIVKGIDIA